MGSHIRSGLLYRLDSPVPVWWMWTSTVHPHYSIICPEDTGAVPVEFHMKYSLDRSSRAEKKSDRTFFKFAENVHTENVWIQKSLRAYMWQSVVWQRNKPVLNAGPRSTQRASCQALWNITVERTVQVLITLQPRDYILKIFISKFLTFPDSNIPDLNEHAVLFIHRVLGNDDKCSNKGLVSLHRKDSLFTFMTATSLHYS